MLPAVGILSAFLLCLVPLIHGQTTGTVSIVDLADWNNAPVDVQKCLWQPGASDVASTLGCPSPTLNVCFCPTGAASSKALSAITGCMTYWFENNGILQLPTAVSVYSEYCADAVGASITNSPTTTLSATASSTSPSASPPTSSSSATSSATSSPSSSGSTLSGGAIGGIVAGGVVFVVIMILLVLYLTVNSFKDAVNHWIKNQGGPTNTNGNAPSTNGGNGGSEAMELPK